MYCAKCQSPLIGGSQLCMICGYDNTLGALPQTATATEHPPQAAQQAPPAHHDQPHHPPRHVPHFTQQEIEGPNWGARAVGAVIILTILGFAGYGLWQLRQQSLERSVLWTVAPMAQAGLPAGGLDFSCTLVQGGRALCWGSNAVGQLGDTQAVRTGRVTVVRAGMGFTQLDAGDRHICGRAENGDVFCWGNNFSGQLGSRNSAECTTGTSRTKCAVMPMAAPATGVLAVSAGVEHTCALNADSTLVCWGSNNRGQLGGPNFPAESLVAHPGPRLRFASVTAGGYHTCGLLASGAAQCWGWNVYSQLGSLGRSEMCGPTTTSRAPCFPQPVAAAAAVRFASLVAGREHTCGIGRDGKTWCWGANQHGELGVGRPGGSTNLPQEVAGSHRFQWIGAGESFTCAIDEANAAWCWGSNAFRQLGTADSANQSAPTQVPLPEPVRSLGLGQRHVCAVMASERVLCWGDGASGQTGHVLLEGTPPYREAGPARNAKLGL